MRQANKGTGRRTDRIIKGTSATNHRQFLIQEGDISDKIVHSFRKIDLKKKLHPVT